MVPVNKPQAPAVPPRQQPAKPAPKQGQDEPYTTKGPGGSVPYETNPLGDDDGDGFGAKGPGGSGPYSVTPPPDCDPEDTVTISGK